jgi:hypothetical protein
MPGQRSTPALVQIGPALLQRLFADRANGRGVIPRDRQLLAA